MKRLALAALLLACGGTAPAPKLSLVPGGSVDLRSLVAQQSGGAPVTWSVDTGGGTITPAGLYTAPSCTAILAALNAPDITKVGRITGTDHVTATWAGGSTSIAITIAEAVLSISVSPTSVTTSPGATTQMSATVHYTCHDQSA